MTLKEAAAREALNYVQDGMTLGLGSGSTTAIFVDLLGKRLVSGQLRHIQGVPTSEGTATQARRLGIPLTTLDEHPRLDLAVDGADEVDPHLNLIKGLGRAHLREKIIAVHAERFLVIVDESKLVSILGTRGPLPVEILPFEYKAHLAWLNTLGCRAELWVEADGSPAQTDNGNYLARCWFEGGISNPAALARSLEARPGIIEHGLFLGMANVVIAAGENGLHVLQRQEATKQ